MKKNERKKTKSVKSSSKKKSPQRKNKTGNRAPQSADDSTKGNAAAVPSDTSLTPAKSQAEVTEPPYRPMVVVEIKSCRWSGLYADPALHVVAVDWDIETEGDRHDLANSDAFKFKVGGQTVLVTEMIASPTDRIVGSVVELALKAAGIDLPVKRDGKDAERTGNAPGQHSDSTSPRHPESQQKAAASQFRPLVVVEIEDFGVGVWSDPAVRVVRVDWDCDKCDLNQANMYALNGRVVEVYEGVFCSLDYIAGTKTEKALEGAGKNWRAQVAGPFSRSSHV